MKNVLLITSDQQHYMTLGINDPSIKTPNLDKLANEGMSFTRAYCPNPTCTPSRASIITGQYPSEHKAWTLGTKLDEDKQTIGDVLLSNGIKTNLIGKAHFQPLREDKEGKYPSLESYPKLQDFDFWRHYKDVFYGFENVKLLRNHTNEAHVGQHYGLWLEDKVGDRWKEYFLEQTGVVKVSDYRSYGVEPHGQYPQGREWAIPLDLHYNEFITSETIKCIDDALNENKPFFTWASYPDPHPDYLVPEPYASMYNPDDIVLPNSYYEQEQGASELLLKTREVNPDFTMYNETNCGNHGCESQIQNERSLKRDIALYYGMITYIDDEVGKLMSKLKEAGIYDKTLIIYTSDHGHYYGQHKLVRKGPFMYEDALRVPFIVSGGGFKYIDNKCSELVNLIDIYPTITEYLKVDYNQLDVQGKSLLPLITNKIHFRDSVFSEFRHEPYKLNLRTFITKRYKLTITLGTNMGEIYDLENDSNEMKNLWDDKELRCNLLLQMNQAQLERETIHMPRIWGA